MTAATDGKANVPALPLDPSSRVSSIGALRGIALFGVLAIRSARHRPVSPPGGRV